MGMLFDSGLSSLMLSAVPPWKGLGNLLPLARVAITTLTHRDGNDDR